MEKPKNSKCFNVVLASKEIKALIHRKINENKEINLYKISKIIGTDYASITRYINAGNSTHNHIKMNTQQVISFASLIGIDINIDEFNDITKKTGLTKDHDIISYCDKNGIPRPKVKVTYIKNYIIPSYIKSKNNDFYKNN